MPGKERDSVQRGNEWGHLYGISGKFTPPAGSKGNTS